MKISKTKDNSILIVTPPLLVDCIGAAKLLSISPAYLRQLDLAGKIPLSIDKFGRRKLWSVSELQKWIDRGCPNRLKWLEKITDE